MHLKTYLLDDWTCFTAIRCGTPTYGSFELIEKDFLPMTYPFDSPTYDLPTYDLIVLPMTYPFLLVNCSYGEGRHIGEIEADLTYKYSIDNLKLDLVTDPSSFRMAMSFVYFHLTHPW